MNYETRAKQRRQDYLAVFGDAAGKRVLQDLMKFCKFTQPVMAPGDPFLTAYNDGMRRVFLRLISVIGMTDEQIAKLPKEANDG